MNWNNGGLRHAIRRNKAKTVLVVLDTSSVLPEDYLLGLAKELAPIVDERKVALTFLGCDTSVFETTYKNLLLGKLPDRPSGGADLRPAFKRAELAWAANSSRLNTTKYDRSKKPDLVAVITDGYTTVPKEDPGCPVYWCLTSDGKAPAMWGETLCS